MTEAPPMEHTQEQNHKHQPAKPLCWYWLEQYKQPVRGLVINYLIHPTPRPQQSTDISAHQEPWNSYSLHFHCSKTTVNHLSHLETMLLCQFTEIYRKKEFCNALSQRLAWLQWDVEPGNLDQGTFDWTQPHTIVSRVRLNCGFWIFTIYECLLRSNRWKIVNGMKTRCWLIEKWMPVGMLWEWNRVTGYFGEIQTHRINRTTIRNKTGTPTKQHTKITELLSGTPLLDNLVRSRPTESTELLSVTKLEHQRNTKNGGTKH